MDCKLIQLNKIGDSTGYLVPIESEKDLPFQIKRVYYIFDTLPGIIRGKHAHKDLQQLLICINGKCKIKIDNGKSKEIVELNSPEKGLFIGKMLWREMYEFSKNTVLLVLADAYYDEKEYIRDYDLFIELANKG